MFELMTHIDVYMPGIHHFMYLLKPSFEESEILSACAEGCYGQEL